MRKIYFIYVFVGGVRCVCRGLGPAFRGFEYQILRIPSFRGFEYQVFEYQVFYRLGFVFGVRFAVVSFLCLFGGVRKMSKEVRNWGVVYRV